MQSSLLQKLNQRIRENQPVRQVHKVNLT